MEEIKLKLYKIGNKILLYFPKKFRLTSKYNKGDIIKITFRKGNNSHCLITKFNHIITIKKEVLSKIRIKKDIEIILRIDDFSPIKKGKKLFYKDKIDLSFFIPEKTKKGSEIYCEEFLINNDSFIRLTSIHLRGSSRQVLLKRFVNPNIFGKLLGQIQAEGTKTNHDVVEFCNKNLFELRDFVNFLSGIGISKENIYVKIDYNSYFKNQLPRIIKKFKNFMGLNVNYLVSSDKGTKGYGFKIIVRNTILSELILNSLNQMRSYLENINWDDNLTSFSEGYLSKILCGDGTFEITSINRKRLQSRIKIYDGNIRYLHHYSTILRKFGFSPYVKEKQIFVRAMCNTSLARKLLEIGAFSNNENRKRIMIFIQNNEATSKKGVAL